jgi:hypothetical protein
MTRATHYDGHKPARCLTSQRQQVPFAIGGGGVSGSVDHDSQLR